MGVAPRPMRTQCGGGRYPLTRPGNNTAVVNYCLYAQQKKTCHSERAAGESKNLRISLTFAVKLVPRSFDSFHSLRMTTFFIILHCTSKLQFIAAVTNRAELTGEDHHRRSCALAAYVSRQTIIYPAKTERRRFPGGVLIIGLRFIGESVLCLIPGEALGIGGTFFQLADFQRIVSVVLKRFAFSSPPKCGCDVNSAALVLQVAKLHKPGQFYFICFSNRQKPSPPGTSSG